MAFEDNFKVPMGYISLGRADSEHYQEEEEDKVAGSTGSGTVSPFFGY